MTDQPTAHLTLPKQDRSRRTLDRLVRASLEILETEGPSGLTVQAVVARADSSVGSFYARFRGKDDLLEYLGERVWHEALDRWNGALASRDWSELGLGQMIEGAVSLLVEAQRSRSTYLEALDRIAGGKSDAYADFRSHLLSGLETLLLQRASEIDHETPEVAVAVGLRAVMGIIDSESGSEESALTRDELTRECVRLLSAYLTGSASAAGEDVDFFEIWS